MALSHQIRGGKHLTLESAWPPNHLQQSDCLHFMFNLEELCPGFLWLCPAEKEGLCLDDDYCRTFRGWYPIWSVPWGNRGRKPVIYEGPFWEGTHWTSQKDCGTDARERWPQTPLRRPRHIWRGSVWFDSAHWVNKLCDNFQVPWAPTFIMIPLCWCWTPQVRSISSHYSYITTPGQSVGTVISTFP